MSLRQLALAAILASTCSACALSTDKIDVPYQSANATPAKLPGAEAATLAVATTDARTTYRDRVSSKKNGYGMEMAAIVNSNDLSETMTSAFSQELTARGFKTGEGGGKINVELEHFYNDFKMGMFSAQAVATVSYNVKVSNAASALIFSKVYEGNGTEPNIMLANGDNARAALIKAFTAGLNATFNDPDFLKAALSAGIAAK